MAQVQYFLAYFSGRLGESRYLPMRRRQRMLQSSANLSRSQRNLQWVKSKFMSLKSNLHEASLQVSKLARFIDFKLFLVCPTMVYFAF